MIPKLDQYDEYPPLRLVRREDNWRDQVREELEEMESSYGIYVIINAWEPEGTDYILTEVVDMKYYDTMDDAWARLLTLADTSGYSLTEDEVGFELEPVTGISYQEYYIEELYRG